MPSEAAADRAPPQPGESRRRPPDSVLVELRRAIGRIEKKYADLEEDAAIVPFGIAPLDAALGGGFAPGALHEIAATGEAAVASASAFALTLAARASMRAVLWVAEETALRESGAPYGPGLDEIGLAPERLITVTVAHARNVPWAMEEALRCDAVGAVIGEWRGLRGVDDVAVRRLSLAAHERGGLALLLRATPSAQATPAETRWIVGPAASVPTPHGIGPPAFAVELVRNRRGVLGSWILEWHCADRRFQLASTHSQPVAPPAADGPDQTAVA